MAAKRPGMMIYFDDWAKIVDLLTPEQFKRLFVLLMDGAQGADIAIPADDQTVCMAYSLLHDKIARDAARYDKICEKRKAAINKRWNNESLQRDEVQMYTNEYKPIQVYTNDTNCNRNRNSNRNCKRNHNSLPLPPQGDGEREETPERPTLEQVRGCAERLRLDCDPDAFYRECEETGWTDGNGNPIRSWKIWLGNWAIKHRQTRRVDDMTQPDDRVAEFERLKQKYLQEEQDDDEG